MQATSPTLLTLLTLLFTSLVAATPYPRDDLRDVGYGYLMARACDSYCGADNQYCCAKDEQCYTSAGIAGCAGSGGWDFFTTTWTETRTYTSTLSSQYAGVTTTAGSTEPCEPVEGTGQIACGPICCANWQYCADSVKGQCMANAGASSYTQWTTIGVITTQFSAPYRVTSGSTIWASSTGTADSETATPTESSGGGATPIGTTNGGLSGGAIAGIVIGTIAGVALLLLCCFCCIVRGLWHTILGIFGIGGGKKRREERIEVTEERYSRHGSVHGGRPQHRTWFGGMGGGGGRPSGAGSRKEKKSGSGLGWMAAGAGAVALLLGLKRDGRHKGGAASSKPPRSDWSSSYYTASYTASSPSEFIPPAMNSHGAFTDQFSPTGSLSSDRRTRNSRRSRHSRATRASRPSRV